jgi:hypothetical protein
MCGCWAPGTSLDVANVFESVSIAQSANLSCYAIPKAHHHYYHLGRSASPRPITGRASDAAPTLEQCYTSYESCATAEVIADSRLPLAI